MSVASDNRVAEHARCAARGSRSLALGLALGVAAAGPAARAGEPLEALVRAYPQHLSHIDSGDLVWRDGTRMPVDDGRGPKPFEQWLAAPDIEDMLQVAYPVGALAAPPARNSDPGRARNAAFFDRMYGDCRSGAVAASLVEIVWLPKKAGQRLKVTRINGVAEKLEAISTALDALPASFDQFLVPSAGTYNCRVIAGTSRTSAHGHGIAIDLAVKRADYWQWARPAADGGYPYRNAMPAEVVAIFEAHGFIWGGKWYHYDTMHFEYRPELLPAPR